jgi:hypothetical protein
MRLAAPVSELSEEQPSSIGHARLLARVPLIGLALVAFAVRWPYLWFLPQFTDETFDGLVSYGIYQGKRPLTGVNAYTGAFHYYLEATIYWLFGPSIYTSRLLVMVLGVGAVIATYLLGAEIGRRGATGKIGERGAHWAGLVAGGLLATNAIHVLTNSHLAWPHCTVLLYLTLAFWLAERAIRLGSGPSLVAAGLMLGLAQQQHPTMVLLWPAMIGYVVWRGRGFFRSRWAYLAIAAFLIGVSPLIAYNVQTDFGTLRESTEQSEGYQQGRDKDWSYRGRATEILLTVARLPASAIDARDGAGAYLGDPIVLGYSALALVGLGLAARLGVVTPALVTVSFLVLLPLFPASHDGLPRQGRYIMPLLPFAFAGIGGLVAWVRTGLGDDRGRIALLGLVATILVAYPLGPLIRHYTTALAANETNARYYITLEAAERLRAPDEMVVLDPSLQRDRTGAAGTALRTFDFLFTLREIPHVTLDQSSERIDRRVPGQTALVIADERPGSATTSANAAVWRAEEIPDAAPGGFTIWRLTRR